MTTLQRVKDRIYDAGAGATQPSTYDSLLTRMINSCSEWFERECGARQFVQRLYSNDIYSAYSKKQSRIITRQAPIFFATITGNTTAGSSVITGVSSTAGMVVGMPIAADNITPTYVTSGNQIRNAIAAISGATITLQAAAQTTVIGAIIQVNGLLQLQWRAGTPATLPSWMNFIADQYELVNDGKAGVVKVYGFIPNLLDNMIRATYYAGYTVDWANAGNGTTHRLPADITDSVENIVVRRFKRRMLAGKGSEALEGATTSWNRDIDVDDQCTIDNYRRMPTIF